MWRFLYNLIAVPLLYTSFHIYSLFNSKVKEGLQGRKDMFRKLSEQVPSDKNNVPLIWFHCASVGEFEQAKPIINALDGKARIAVTFFSPSGYQSAAKYTKADLICYLPLDSARNARRMFSLLKPAILIFMRFDIWPNHVWTASKAGVPIILADATLHEKSKRLWPIARSFLKSIHKHINLHCAISELDKERFKRICPKNADIRVMGDTRFDQVIARRNSAGKKLEGLLPKFQTPVIIAGSTYIEDEEVVIDAYQKILTKNVQLILVPHEPEPERLSEIGKLMSEYNIPHILLSEIEKGADATGKAIVIDRVGVLAELYQLGDITFIGGSFHGSVHNVMEPAIMGKPVLFGPTIHNSLEAIMLQEIGSGIMVRNSEEMATELIKLLQDEELRIRLGKAGQKLIEENAGATEKIIDCIENFGSSD
jgi:3-deoxy-D-manno-octulosonic-acid transferase